MALSKIESKSPNTPSALTSLLQGGGSMLSQALSNAIQLGRDSVNKQTLAERSFLAERRAEINLSQRRGENVVKQGNADRAFDESVTRDRRDFARNVFSQDRSFDRGVFTQDRSYERGVVVSDRSYGLAQNADTRANEAGERSEESHSINLAKEEDRKEDRDFMLTERERALAQREDAQNLLDTPVTVSSEYDSQSLLVSDEILTAPEIAQREAAAASTGDKPEAAKWKAIRETREALDRHRRDLEVLKAREDYKANSKEGQAKESEVDFLEAIDSLQVGYPVGKYDFKDVEYARAVKANTFKEFFQEERENFGAFANAGALTPAQKSVIRKKWLKFYNVAKKRSRGNASKASADAVGLKKTRIEMSNSILKSIEKGKANLGN